MANYALMGDGKVIDGEPYEELRGTKDAENGDTIHVVVEVQDNGKHQLKHCQRVIITVK